MKTYILAPALMVVALGASGCSGGSSAGGTDRVRANLAKLSPEDRTLAEAQRFCAVEENNRLGSMGAPVKVMVKGRPVFLCCAGCRKRAEARPDETLARAEKLRAGAADGSP